MPPLPGQSEDRAPTARQLEVLRIHGWGNCQGDKGYCWHHPFYDLGNEWHTTDEALERTQHDASKLLALMAGTGPTEDGYADTYDVMRLDPEEREQRARAGRAREGFEPVCRHSNLRLQVTPTPRAYCVDCGKDLGGGSTTVPASL